MKYCNFCLQPDTRPGTRLSIDGLCPACIYSQNLNNIDWKERYEILQNIIEKKIKSKKNNLNIQKKSKFNKHYDCVIGVSGGKDSTRQALYVRDKLKLKPLLVCLAYPPEQITNLGASNISNLINLGFDVEILSLAPQNWKKLLKTAFMKYANWAKASEHALYATVPRIAIRYKIPIIFWGENPAIQFGDLNTKGKEEYEGSNLSKMNTLGGGKIDWLYKFGFEEKNIFNFSYPKKSEFKKNNVENIYLGWFFANWNIKNNASFSILYGLNLREDHYKNTQDLYGIYSLDEDWVTLNQMIKYYKYGFGRVSDYVCDDIRFGQITRNQGIKILEKYDGKCGEKYIKSFCEYIDISLNTFWRVVHKHVNKKLFKIEKNNNIKPLFKVGKGLI